ncbi:hypothetical protein [Streptomyces ureilyticus]|uniref:Transcriptional regulator n=1 Tax=Streptomyces ureilyticus TaxID=1775131 RepID=A0ABX0DFI9_9ACTN|nr:hypothetical protein [Streptomyces ureilyticus]NGO40631.1 hypothetical protein [Streptomyces ureilyticus]
MNDSFGEVTAADIAQLLRDIDKAAWRLGYARDEVLDLKEVSRAAGIKPDRVRELLDGDEPQQPPRTKKEREAFYRQLVGQRLDLLRSGDSYRTIGDEVDLTHSLIGDLVNGERSARPEYSHPLETRYEVDHGFLSKPEGRALADHLAKVKEGLLAGALLEGLQELGGGQQVALRHAGKEPPTMEELVEAMDALVARTAIQRRRKGTAAPDDADRS